MSVVYLNEERYCQVCSHPLGPDDDPRGFHRGPCPQPYAKAPSRDVWDYSRAKPPVAAQTAVKEPVTAAIVTSFCRECGGSLVKPKRGPMPAFCSDACRQAAHRKGTA